MRLFDTAVGTSTPLIGREQECDVLSRLFEKVMATPDTPLEVCLVHGDAGSGKTRYAETNVMIVLSTLSLLLTHNVFTYDSVIRHVAAEQQNRLGNNSNITLHFVSGKFEQYQDFSSPYAVIVNAFEQILNGNIKMWSTVVK